MDKEDARYQKLEQLHERRKQVVRLHRKGLGVNGIDATRLIRSASLNTTTPILAMATAASE